MHLDAKPNPYQQSLERLFNKTPKAVLAAIAVSFLKRLGGGEEDTDTPAANPGGDRRRVGHPARKRHRAPESAQGDAMSQPVAKIGDRIVIERGRLKGSEGEITSVSQTGRPAWYNRGAICYREDGTGRQRWISLDRARDFRILPGDAR